MLKINVMIGTQSVCVRVRVRVCGERESFSLLQNAVPVSILKCQKGNLWFSHGAPWTVGTVPVKALAHKNIIFQ